MRGSIIGLDDKPAAEMSLPPINAKVVDMNLDWQTDL